MGTFFRASAVPGISLLICSLFLWATPAAAELTFSFEVSGKYEDNVTGVARDNANIGADTRHGGGATVGGVHLKTLNASGPGGGGGGLDDLITGGTGTAAQAEKQGDFSTTLYADIGTHHDLSDKTSLLLLLSVDHTAYNKFTDLDFTIGTAIAGLGHRFSESFSGRLEASAALRDVKFDGADSVVYGLTASLKERIGEAVWLRESATIEQSKADNSINDYTGTDLSVRAGYDFASRSSLSAGYSYLLRDFKNSPVGVQTSVQAASLDWSMDLSDQWSILAGYDHEWIKVKTDIDSGTADNNVYSAAVRYDF